MRVLIIGGTAFLGRHVVDAALDRGDEVTVFHRGLHPAPRPAEVTEVLGDRTVDLTPLVGRRFDAVIDTCGYLPADVGRSASEIDAEQYVFVSTASVYADDVTVPVTEDQPTLEPPGPAVTDVHGELYGPQKVGCERALRETRAGSALILRAGLLVGPYDPTDRLTYWAMRFRRPGPVLAPDVRDHPVQWLDARDLARWSIDAAEAGLVGTMNAAGPGRALTFGGLVELASDLAEDSGLPRPDIRWVAEQTLLDAGVQPWTELPMWVPTAWNAPGVFDLDVRRIEAAGLTTRPLRDTLRDLVAWASTDSVRVEADYGTRARSLVLTPERERELLTRLT